MPKINILPAKVYNRIAAGEVVDRPYSVVKELVENSIDAGATEIEIYIEQGGKQLIRVVDNGCGIERDDLQSAFLPHATSKIAQAEDLDNIFTLGFRGEAVASIAAVSKMTITSKTAEGKRYSLHSNGGELGTIKEVVGDNGTEVCVEMLFFNTPVRLGFLKTDKGEEADITNFVSRFILSRPEISFTYYVNGKKTLQSFGGGAAEALVEVYGAATLAQCYEINAERHGISIRGFIGNQGYFKANKSYQSIFLSGRYIQNLTISSAISNAYASYAMKRQYPFYVLYIDVPGEIVDVNVHPNKADVRFADNKIVYGCIYTILSAVLDGQPQGMDYVVRRPTASVYADEGVQEAVEPPVLPSYPPVFKPEPKPETIEETPALTYEEAKKEVASWAPTITVKKSEVALPFEGVGKQRSRVGGSGEKLTYVSSFAKTKVGKKEKTRDDSGLREIFPDLYYRDTDMQVKDSKPQTEEQNVFEENKRFLQDLERKNKQNRIDINSCTFSGKLFNTYLMYECGDKVYIIDQHAAHERLIYDRLKEQMDARRVMVQPMLVPYEFEVNAAEQAFIEAHLGEIREIGFNVKQIGMDRFMVNAIPLDLQYINLEAFFREILGNIEGYNSIRLTDLLKDKLATAACKAAVKGGMDLTRAEIDELFELMDGDMGLKCPHGRPVVVKVARTELEKMFKRIV